MWISAYPLEEIDDFLKVHTFYVHEFCVHVPNSPRNKNLKWHISYLLEKVVFLDPKKLLAPLGSGK
jgi:hypothetical protein